MHRRCVGWHVDDAGDWVAELAWGVLRVLDGALSFSMFGVERRMAAGDEQPIPPDVPHLLSLDRDVRLEVDFLVSPG